MSIVLYLISYLYLDVYFKKYLYIILGYLKALILKHNGGPRILL